ncbi:MAG: DUF262 domain-containing protein [Fimbriimonadaceae bacterium]|nr:DUF262 domain-containing protein [Fimbriimonadaceae bacterium]
MQWVWCGEGREQTDEIEGYEPAEAGGWEGYPLDELAIRDERRTAMDVNRRIQQGRFILDPDFQRDFVWDRGKQSRLIESILLRIPLPVFYVAEDTDGRFIVVDGRQRLTTLLHFFAGHLKLHLPDRAELNKKSFHSLESRLQNRIEDCQLHFYIIDHAVPERARLDIFERVNGGEVLTRQQMRNAIFSGPSTAFLRAVADSDLFSAATGGSLNKKKMQDREFVNRFCSFQLFGLEDYRGDMDDWLAKSLGKLNKTDDGLIETLGSQLQLSLQNNLSVFGEHAFRKHRPEQSRRGLINASLFDVMSTGLAKYSEAQVSSASSALKERFYALMEDEDFTRSITYSPNTPNVVRRRFKIAHLMLKEVFDA